jgi:hypothetical protein
MGVSGGWVGAGTLEQPESKMVVIKSKEKSDRVII